MSQILSSKYLSLSGTQSAYCPYLMMCEFHELYNFNAKNFIIQICLSLVLALFPILSPSHSPPLSSHSAPARRRNMSRCGWHDSFMHVTTYSWCWRDSFVHMWDMTYSYVPWLNYMCDMTHLCTSRLISGVGMAHSFIRVTWLMQCAMTHSYASNESFINVESRSCVLQCVVVCCSVLQCVVVCCSVLQCVAVCLMTHSWNIESRSWYWPIPGTRLDVSFIGLIAGLKTCERVHGCSGRCQTRLFHGLFPMFIGLFYTSYDFSCVSVSCLIHVQHDSPSARRSKTIWHVIWLLHLCDMTESYVSDDLFMCLMTHVWFTTLDTYESVMSYRWRSQRVTFVFWHVCFDICVLALGESVTCVFRLMSWEKCGLISML